MDAGARLRRKKQREEHRRYVNDIIPDHLKDEYIPIMRQRTNVVRENITVMMTKSVNLFPKDIK